MGTEMVTAPNVKETVLVLLTVAFVEGVDIAVDGREVGVRLVVDIVSVFDLSRLFAGRKAACREALLRVSCPYP
jgi:hypothetical protein